RCERLRHGGGRPPEVAPPRFPQLTTCHWVSLPFVPCRLEESLRQVRGGSVQVRGLSPTVQEAVPLATHNAVGLGSASNEERAWPGPLRTSGASARSGSRRTIWRPSSPSWVR